MNHTNISILKLHNEKKRFPLCESDHGLKLFFTNKELGRPTHQQLPPILLCDHHLYIISLCDICCIRSRRGTTVGPVVNPKLGHMQVYFFETISGMVDQTLNKSVDKTNCDETLYPLALTALPHGIVLLQVN